MFWILVIYRMRFFFGFVFELGRIQSEIITVVPESTKMQTNFCRPQFIYFRQVSADLLKLLVEPGLTLRLEVAHNNSDLGHTTNIILASYWVNETPTVKNVVYQ